VIYAVSMSLCVMVGGTSTNMYIQYTHSSYLDVYINIQYYSSNLHIIYFCVCTSWRLIDTSFDTFAILCLCFFLCLCLSVSLILWFSVFLLFFMCVCRRKNQRNIPLYLHLVYNFPRLTNGGIYIHHISIYNIYISEEWYTTLLTRCL